jgi:hydrogenase maturation protein HypF
MVDKGVNSPLTSSCGRLFDAVAALTGRWQEAGYEAQAAIELMALTDVDSVQMAESFLEEAARAALLDRGEKPFLLPVSRVISGAVTALASGAGPAEISARFHRTLIDLFVAGVQEASARTGLRAVVLSGGVFQNEILLTLTQRRLDEAGFAVHRPVLVPINDGAVALGQAAVARARLAG